MNKTPESQQKLISLKPGFYAFRYLCDDAGERPVATLGYAPSTTPATVTLVGPKKAGQVVLGQYGDMAVAYVEDGDAKVSLTLYIPRGYPQRAVKLEVERLEGIDPLGTSNDGNVSHRSTSLVGLSGHLEGIGDIDVQPGDWLGKPHSQQRLEGFTILWPGRPFGVDLAYHCTVAGMGQSPTALTGSFVGSRQRAAPIRAVNIAFYGENSHEFHMRVLACFARAGIVEADSGGTVSGLESNDFLVALKVIVECRKTDGSDSRTSRVETPNVRTFTSSSFS